MRVAGVWFHPTPLPPGELTNEPTPIQHLRAFAIRNALLVGGDVSQDSLRPPPPQHAKDGRPANLSQDCFKPRADGGRESTHDA